MTSIDNGRGVIFDLDGVLVDTGWAHRQSWLDLAEREGFEVIIAAAGMSNALAGAIAAHTCLPVVGVPLVSGSLSGMDALLSTVQMPPGIPVAAVSVGDAGAKMYGCQMAMEMFKLERNDLVPQVADVITAMDFFDVAAGSQVMFI